MKGVSTFTDAEHTVEWRINPTHILLLLLLLYVVTQTDILEGRNPEEDVSEALKDKE